MASTKEYLDFVLEQLSELLSGGTDFYSRSFALFLLDCSRLVRYTVG